MKKIFALTLVIFAVSFCGRVIAQEDLVRMDATTNGTTVLMADYGGTLTIRDDDSQGEGAPEAGSPMYDIDYTLTIQGNCTGEKRLSISVAELAVCCGDTVYIYDGADINAPLIKKFNNVYGDVVAGDYIFVTPTNNSGLVTIRFRTAAENASVTNSACYSHTERQGFVFSVSCIKPCEEVTPVILDKFYRTRNGEIYDSAYIREVEILDTVYVDAEDPSSGIDRVDTARFLGAHLCIGDGVIFQATGQYSYKYGYYTPSDSTTLFKWDFGNQGDSLVQVGANRVTYNDYQSTGCYDVELRIVDSYGCFNGSYAGVRVRTSLNPIKSIFTLADICNSDSLMVNMGYSGENATLTLREVENDSIVSKTYESVTFIPDGCNCSNQNPNYNTDYFEAPVLFTEFPNNKRIRSAADICSICINMEHSFMGDFFLTIVCPTNQEALIKVGSTSSCSPAGISVPSSGPGTSTGGGTYLGWPTENGNEAKCDNPWVNPYGIGMDYCFSRNNDYTLISGEQAGSVWSATNLHPSGNFYIGDDHTNLNTLPMTAAPTPDPLPANYVDANGVAHSWGQYAGQRPSILTSGKTRKPSNHEEKTDYYLPYTTFDELVGCPLNGEWKMRVYDTWGIDNGWIFNWSMDICGVSQDDDCRYTVGIDSLIWVPDPDSQYCDYDMGRYRGAKVRKETPTISYISSPDTAGTFPILVKVYDEFGCEWDTNTRITTFWTPKPRLGEDTALCGVDTRVLDASDPHAESQGYTYVWAPNGENTPTITTQQFPSGDITYIVSARNSTQTLLCEARDTINIKLRRQPLPSFSLNPFVFEGCSPLTLHFDNQSVEAAQHLWVFGDGITSTLANPTHTYGAGLYDLKYYATSADGCVDSVISPQSIAVYDAPQASFEWAPIYPSVLNPTVHLTNNTVPQTDYTKYFWEIQYNRDNPISVETKTDFEPVFDFSQYTDEDPTGIYTVRLIARTDNLAPSGNVIYCRDTTENTILLVNDFLQFPNVVTPNGDGINDRFVIQNLVNGMGYPVNALDIYNKWGTRVYHKENITRDEDFWDPKDLPSGTYFYRFSAKGYNGNIEHNGAIEVVR